MRATSRRAGAIRLQALQAEAVAASNQKPTKPLASYFSGPAAPKTGRPTSVSDASA